MGNDLGEFEMSKLYLVLILLLFLTLQGCELKPTDAPVATETKTDQKTEIKKIKFEATSFTLDYENSEGRLSDERYTGSGIITVSGDELIVKKPYLVLLQVKKISGGEKRSSGERMENVIVINGIGRFFTDDWNFVKNEKMEKPVYEFKIIGYIPYLEVENQQNK